MTVLGFLANAAILSSGALGFWLIDREVRPPAPVRLPKQERVRTPAALPAPSPLADVIVAKDNPRLEPTLAPDRDPIVRLAPRPLPVQSPRPIGPA
jgi:hypothetical protein